MSGGNAQIALQILDPPTAFAGQNAQQLAGETLSSGQAYVLYRWTREGADEVALFVVDVATSGIAVIQSLLVPPDRFVPDMVSVQQSFQINGVAPFIGLDPAAFGPLIHADMAPTPPASPTPTPGFGRPTRPYVGEATSSAASTTSTPAAATTPTVGLAGQSLTVAGATITYSTRWVLDTINSVPDSVAYFDAADWPSSWFAYRPAQSAGGDAATELATLFANFMQNIGATEVQQLTMAAISPTIAWTLTTAKLSGAPIAILTYADTSTTGQTRIQVLYSTQPPNLAAMLIDAQSDIRVDGEQAFASVDPAAVAALLGGGLTTSVPETTPSSGGTGTALGQFSSERYSYTLTYDPAVWQLTPDSEGDVQEWITLVSDASTVYIAGRPDTTGGDLTRCVNAYLLDYGWDNGPWEAEPIEPLLVEPGRVAGSFVLTDQIFGSGTAYIHVECRDIGSGNTLLIAHFVLTAEGEIVPVAEVAKFEQLMAGLRVGAAQT